MLHVEDTRLWGNSSQSRHMLNSKSKVLPQKQSPVSRARPMLNFRLWATPTHQLRHCSLASLQPEKQALGTTVVLNFWTVGAHPLLRTQKPSEGPETAGSIIASSKSLNTPSFSCMVGSCSTSWPQQKSPSQRCCSYWGPSTLRRDPLLPHDLSVWEKCWSKGRIRGYFIIFALFKHWLQRLLSRLAVRMQVTVTPEGDSSQLFTKCSVKKSIKQYWSLCPSVPPTVTQVCCPLSAAFTLIFVSPK